MTIQASYQVGPLDSGGHSDVMVTLRFIIPRENVHEGMTPKMDEVVLMEMSVALAQARQEMKGGEL